MESGEHQVSGASPGDGIDGVRLGVRSSPSRGAIYNSSTYVPIGLIERSIITGSPVRGSSGAAIH